jgi:hypothetical protein
MLFVFTKANPAYLEPNKNSMQKPIGGRSLLADFSTH